LAAALLRSQSRPVVGFDNRLQDRKFFSRIPLARRAGLNDLKRCWIVVDEYNYDVAEPSWYIEPDEKVLGRFCKLFMRNIAASFGEAFEKSGRRINRMDSSPEVFFAQPETRLPGFALGAVAGITARNSPKVGTWCLSSRLTQWRPMPSSRRE
jgi:hypothetical protein